jgi:hypothetical protein
VGIDPATPLAEILEPSDVSNCVGEVFSCPFGAKLVDHFDDLAKMTPAIPKFLHA